ncbi:MAG: iron-sulfur cluster assembly scaffold protein [Gemmatimonadota bacterium]
MDWTSRLTDKLEEILGRMARPVEGGRIARICFGSCGCRGAIATSSMATALARGRTLAEGR